MLCTLMKTTRSLPLSICMLFTPAIHSVNGAQCFKRIFLLTPSPKIATLAVTYITISTENQPKHYHLKLDLPVHDVSFSCIISGIYSVFKT